MKNHRDFGNYLTDKPYYPYNTVEKVYYAFNTVYIFHNTMLDFDSYKQEKGIPIYLQLVGYIKSCIASGTVCDGDELPSRRWLSARLAINPNTVQKAFAMLEEEGLIVSRGGSGSVFTLSEDKAERIRGELFEAEMKKLVRDMKKSGMAYEDAMKLLKESWEAEE